MDKRVLVIGCGIAGPVVAMALARAGLDPELYEAHSGSADDVGSFLNLATNGLAALASIGVGPHVLADGFPTPRMVMWSGTGKRLGEMPNGPTLDDGTVSLTLKRGQLHRALREEARRRGLPVQLGKRLRAAEPVGGGVLAHFDDGSQARGALLVGADGLHSLTRSLIDPSCPAPHYTGQLSVGGIAERTSLSPTPGEYHLVFGHQAFLGFSVRPSGEAYWFANAASPEPHRHLFRQGTWQGALRELFRDDKSPARELFEATTRPPVAHAIYDLPRVPRWHRGPMVLIGDAAHATSPSSGQGASLAIEDAAVLAACLREAKELEPALVDYEHKRRARVERVVRYSRRVGSTKVLPPVARHFRDLVMPLMLKLFARENAQAWLFRHRLEG